MYQVNSKGRDNVMVYQSYDGTSYERFILLIQLHKALADDQFVLHYHPRIELKTSVINSVKAHIRWNHPIIGLILPVEFIQLAEESGFIIPLGEWAIREACRQQQAWQASGFPVVRIAIDVSAQQFHQDSFVSTVEEIMSDTGMTQGQLEVVITEYLLMSQEQKIVEKLQQLKKLGVYVSSEDK